MHRQPRRAPNRPCVPHAPCPHPRRSHLRGAARSTQGVSARSRHRVAARRGDPKACRRCRRRTRRTVVRWRRCGDARRPSSGLPGREGGMPHEGKSMNLTCASAARPSVTRPLGRVHADGLQGTVMPQLVAVAGEDRDRHLVIEQHLVDPLVHVAGPSTRTYSAAAGRGSSRGPAGRTRAVMANADERRRHGVSRERVTGIVQGLPLPPFFRGACCSRYRRSRARSSASSSGHGSSEALDHVGFIAAARFEGTSRGAQPHGRRTGLGGAHRRRTCGRAGRGCPVTPVAGARGRS